MALAAVVGEQLPAGVGVANRRGDCSLKLLDLRSDRLRTRTHALAPQFVDRCSQLRIAEQPEFSDDDRRNPLWRDLARFGLPHQLLGPGDAASQCVLNDQAEV